MKKRIIIGIVSAAVIFTACFIIFNSKGKELQMNTAVIEMGEIELTVTATGYVQPVDKVEVGTQVSGVIEKIYVDFNSHVKKGQLLAELDKSTLKERVLQGEASVTSAKSELTYAQQNYDRVSQLYEAKATTQSSYEAAVNQLSQAKTAVINAQANLHQANVNLSYAEIYSPIDGIVLYRAVQQGQTVAASFSTPTLFTIANDLKNMKVEANVDEADIGQVKVGQKVNFTVDSYPDETFAGTVNQVRLNPIVTSNVVTYTVIISAPNPDEALFPGMTASVTIITKSEQGALVPLQALNYMLPLEVAEHLNIKTENSEGIKTNNSVPQMRRPGFSQSGGGIPQGGAAVQRGNGLSQSSGEGSFQQRGGRPNSPQGMKEKHKKDSGYSKVWVKNGDKYELRHIQTGLSDGAYLIVLDGLNENDTVILSASFEKKETKSGKAVSNPLMPQRRR